MHLEGEIGGSVKFGGKKIGRMEFSPGVEKMQF